MIVVFIAIVGSPVVIEFFVDSSVTVVFVVGVVLVVMVVGFTVVLVSRMVLDNFDLIV